MQLKNSFFAFMAILAALAAPIAAWAQAGPPQGRYIVVLNPDTGIPEDVAADVALRTNGRIGYIYEHALQGFSITMPRTAASGIARDPRIAYIEEDLPVSIVAQTLPTGVDRIYEPDALNGAVGGDTSIDDALSIDGVDDWRVDAAVAVLDTGIDREHPDLNVVGGANCLKYDGKGPPFARSYYCDDTESGDDDHYHGTHVAGTIGALDNDIGVVGVAPGVRLYAVKVLDSGGSGYTSGIIAGIDWVSGPISGREHIDVINMSLGGAGVNQAYETAIANAVTKGVVVVVAAGNSDANANNYSPAFAPSAITVSALADFNGISGGNGAPTCRTDQDDTLADFSNWGSAVDIAAPGVCILSTYPIEKGSYDAISGTSMASPHVAGAAALLASTGMTVADIRSALLTTGNGNWIDDSGDGNKEPLLDISRFFFDYSAPGLVAGPSNVGNAAPTARFDPPDPCVAGSACNFDGSGSTDADGTIVAYDWDFGDSGGTSGVIANHAFPSNTIDVYYDVKLTVTDNDGASGNLTHSVLVAGFNSGGGDPNDIYVWNIQMSDRGYGPGGTFHDLTTTVTIKRDSDADGVAEDSDVAASGASVTIKVTLADARVFEGTVQVDGNGQGSYILKRVPTGTHTGEVTDVTLGTYVWNKNLGTLMTTHSVE